MVYLKEWAEDDQKWKMEEQKAQQEMQASAQQQQHQLLQAIQRHSEQQQNAFLALSQQLFDGKTCLQVTALQVFQYCLLLAFKINFKMLSINTILTFST